jgi:hypothetical protein
MPSASVLPSTVSTESNREGTMRNYISAGVRAVVVPALACSLVCGGVIIALAALGVRAFADNGAVPAAGPDAPALRPPAAVVVRTPPPPPVTAAPTAAVWTVPFKG